MLISIVIPCYYSEKSIRQVVELITEEFDKNACIYGADMIEYFELLSTWRYFMRIHVTSDSTCDLSPELIERYHITIAPLYVVMDEKSYKDTLEITPEDIEDVERILVEDDLNDSLKGQDYQFYTEKRLDELLEDMIESFMNDYIYTRNRV